MNRIVVLDAGPLGILCAPPNKSSVVEGLNWLSALLSAGVRVVLPEITDYEVRRELIRAGKLASIIRLNELTKITEYSPLTTLTIRLAAEIWATARQTGQPTAGDNTIDADVILIAQTLTLHHSDIIIATTNVGHLARFAPAQIWSTITS